MNLPFTVYDFFGYLATGFVLLFAADYAFEFDWLHRENLPPGVIVFSTIAAYTIGHVVAQLSSYLLEHKVVRALIRSPEETLFTSEPRGWQAYVFPSFMKPFPVTTQQRVLKKAKAAGIEEPSRALFFHCHAIVKGDKTTLERLNTFLNIYGFCRNVSLASFLAGVFLVVAALWIHTGDRGPKLLWGGIAFATAIALFYRYLKFFKHFTEEVFRTYAELPGHATPDTEQAQP